MTIRTSRTYTTPQTPTNTAFVSCTFKAPVVSQNCTFTNCTLEDVGGHNVYAFLTAWGRTQLMGNRFLGRFSDSCSAVWIRPGSPEQNRILDRSYTWITEDGYERTPIMAPADHVLPENGNTWFQAEHRSDPALRLFWGANLALFDRGSIVTGNHFENWSLAGCFLSGNTGFVISNNTCVNCMDYGVGAEGSEYGLISGNSVGYTAEAKERYPHIWSNPNSFWGGIAIMHYSRGIVIEGNNSEKQIRMISQGQPIVDCHIRHNYIDGDITVASDRAGGHRYPVWVKNCTIEGNRLSGGVSVINNWSAECRITPEVEILRNVCGRDRRGFGIRLSGAKARIIGNEIAGDFRDENQVHGDSEIVAEGNSRELMRRIVIR